LAAAVLALAVSGCGSTSPTASPKRETTTISETFGTSYLTPKQKAEAAKLLSHAEAQRRREVQTAATAPIDRPAHPIWECTNRYPSRQGCSARFDARALLGLTMPRARELAKTHDYQLRRTRPLAEHEYLTLDLESNRIDVETNAPTETSTVIRIIELG
jgi:hypothetical protein